MAARLQEKYKTTIVSQLQEKLGIKNSMAVPRMIKIVINMGVGAAIHDIKVMDTAMNDLARITGQRPAVRRSKKAISNFKLRAGQPIGCMVTLRGARMYEFMDRLVNICLPRIRDFNGLSRKSFDDDGNYNMGISDQAIFPEIDTGNILRAQGMNITFVFNHGPKEHTYELLQMFGVPFKKN